MASAFHLGPGMNDRRDMVRSHATSPLLPAALFFFFGWMQYIDTDSSLTDFYNFSVHWCNWSLRIGSILFLIAAVACYAGIAAGLLLDAVVTACCALMFLVVGANWSSYGFVNGYLFVIFAFMFGTAARRSFQIWKSMRGVPLPSDRTPPARPLHPAEIHPDVLPKADEPPPPEGYLARLAREKREAPRADHE